MGYETLNFPWWINNVNVSYKGWAPGNPGSPGSEHCAIINEGAWNDLPCICKSKFICEKNETYQKLT
jgi:hypothetical protein